MAMVSLAVGFCVHTVYSPLLFQKCVCLPVCICGLQISLSVFSTLTPNPTHTVPLLHLLLPVLLLLIFITHQDMPSILNG